MARSFLLSSCTPHARTRPCLPRQAKLPPEADARCHSRLSALLLGCLLALVLSLVGGVATADATTTLNLQARDGSIVLQNLGKGNAAFLSLVTDGSKAKGLKYWQGKLPVASTRYVAGDLNADQYTDVAALVKLPKGKVRLLVFTSTGKKLKPAASWKGKLDWASARLSVGYFVPDQTRDLAITSKGGGGGTQITLFRLAGKKVVCQPLALVPAGTVPANALMTSGDVNGDFHDELVFFGPGASASTGRLVALVNNNSLWQAQKTWEGAAILKGAQLSCGDVDGDGIAEAVALTADGGGTVMKFDCDGPEVVRSTIGARAVGIPSTACRLSVTDMTGDEYADLVSLQKNGRTRLKLVVSVSDGKTFAGKTYWSGKGAYAACGLSCTRTLPSVERNDVHTLSAAAVTTLVSVTDDWVVTFSGAPSEVTSLRKGDVLLIEPVEPLAPSGVMRTVDSVTVAGGLTVIQTTTANLEDVFVQAEIDVKAPVQAASDASGLKRAGRETRDARDLTLQLTIPFDDVTLFSLAGQEAVLDGNLTAGLTLDCWVKITVKWKYGFIPIPTIKARVAVTFFEEASLSVTVTGSVSKEFSKDFDLDFIELPEIKFMVGPIPVWIEPKVYLEFYGEIGAESHTRIQVSERTWATLGVEYNGGWKNLCDGGIEIAHPKITADHLFKAKMGVMLKGAGLFYGIFGPEMGLGGFARFVWGPQFNPYWICLAGIDAEIGARLEVPSSIGGRLSALRFLEGDYGFDFTLFEWLVGEGPLDKSKPRSTTVYTLCDAATSVDPPWNHGPVTVNFEGVSYGSKFKETEYSLDGSKWKSLMSALDIIRGKTKSSVTVAGEGQHKLQYRSRALGGEREDDKTVLIRIDTTAPTVAVTGADAVGTAEWRDAPVTLHIAAADKPGGSGILNASLYVDGEAHRFPSGTGDYVVEKEGLVPLSWDAEDVARYTSSLGRGELKLDLKPPLVNVAGADDEWHDGPITLAFPATDVHDGIEGSGVAKTEYRVGRRGVFGEWTEGEGVTVTGIGDHTVQIRSTDIVGHVATQEVHAKIDPARDSVAPTTAVTPALTGWLKADVTLTFTPNDPAPSSGIEYTEYKLGAADWVRGTSTVVSTEGSTEVQYRSIDLHGNEEAAKTGVVKLDKTLPTVTLSGADDEIHGADVTLTFSATDAVSGVNHIEYKVDDSRTTSDDNDPYKTGAQVLLAAPDSDVVTYTVTCRAVDNAGNVSTTKTGTVKFNTKDAVPTWDSGPADHTWHNGAVTLTFSATKGGTKVPTQYLVDKDPQSPASVWTTGSSLTLSAPKDHSNDDLHHVFVRAAENADIILQRYIGIDTTAPVISWTAGAGVDLTKWLNKPATLTFTAKDLPGKAGTISSGVTDLGLRDTGGLEWVGTSLSPGASVVRDVAVGSHYVAGVAVGPRVWAATGEPSKLWFSDDLGKTWSSVDLGLDITPSTVECPTPGTVWVANSDIISVSGQTIFAIRSTDGGGTWSSWSVLDKEMPIRALACQPGAAGKAWVAVRSTGVWWIHGTVDGGATWTWSQSPGVLTDIACAPDGQNLWAVGEAGLILHSSDGGGSWVQQTSSATGTLQHVDCRNGQVAWISSAAEGVRWTRDGGANWTSMTYNWPAGLDSGLIDLAPTSDTTFVGLGWGLGAPVVRGDDADRDGTWDMTVATSDRIFGVSPHADAGILVDADGNGFAWDGQLRNMLVDRNDTQGAWEDHTYSNLSSVDLDHTVSRDGSVTVDATAADQAGNEAALAPAPVVKIDTVAPLTPRWGDISADNPGGSGVADVSFRATQTVWSSVASPLTEGLTSIEYADARHGVAGWHDNYDPASAGAITTSDGGATWTKHPLDAGSGTSVPEMSDVACAWVDPIFYWTSVAMRRDAVGATDFKTTDFVTLTSWQASVATLVGSWALRESAPGPFPPEAEVKGVACPPNDPDDTWAVGDGRFWYKAGHAAGDSWTEVPLAYTMFDVSACKVGSDVHAWGVGANMAVYALGTDSAALQWSTSEVEDSLTSVDSGVMADGELHVWAVGSYSIVHSGDGGVTWSQTTVPEGHTFSEVSVGSRSVFALADNASVWRKTLGEDGTWSDWVEGPGIAGDNAVRAMAAGSDMDVTAVGYDGAIWRTTTGSTIWQPVVDGVWVTPAATVPYEYRATDVAGNVEQTRTHTEY